MAIVLLLAVCPAGTYEDSGKCVRCTSAFYCPSGNGNDATSTANANSVSTAVPTTPSSEDPSAGFRSFKISCGVDFATRLPGAKEETSCGECPCRSKADTAVAAEQ